MANLTDLIISHPEFVSFDELENVVAEIGRNGEALLYFDTRPEYPDTPRQWQQRLELAFYGSGRQGRE